MALTDEQIAGILRAVPEVSLVEVVAALIEAMEYVGHPRQDNITVSVYTPIAAQ